MKQLRYARERQSAVFFAVRPAGGSTVVPEVRYTYRIPSVPEEA